MAGGRVDPFENFRFRVEIDGIVQAGFTECSGLGSHIEVIEVREGTDPSSATRKLPGRVTYPDIVLKWGVTASRELYNWHKGIIDGQVQRKNGSIIFAELGTARSGAMELLQRMAEQVRGADAECQGQ